MSSSFVSDPTPYFPHHDATRVLDSPSLPGCGVDHPSGFLEGLSRRWSRERRRRKVGRAYDMALEIARMLPQHAHVLDVGCGSGYIGHHLRALLQADVTGIDLASTTEAPINYRQFDGENFPVESQSIDAILLCYVLHHAQGLEKVMRELQRVLARQGVVVVYEDIPERWWDRVVCAIHDRKWRTRTGPCTFHAADEWRNQFSRAGFQSISERKLSRWRNLAHPVSRRVYLLKSNQ